MKRAYEKFENQIPELIPGLTLLDSRSVIDDRTAEVPSREQDAGYPLMYLAWYIAGLGALIFAMAI